MIIEKSNQKLDKFDVFGDIMLDGRMTEEEMKNFEKRFLK